MAPIARPPEQAGSPAAWPQHRPGPTIQAPPLRVVGLGVRYSQAGREVVPFADLTASFEPGTVTALLGPSGSGKTTLLACLAGLQVPHAGRIHHGSTEVSALRGAALATYRLRAVGLVFQAFNLVAGLSARENVSIPLRAGRMGRAAARDRSGALLRRVDLAGLEDTRPGRLSGGQQQRVAIARALALDPPLLLADEPTAHLDHVQVVGILQLLRSLAADGRVVVIATHDERVVRMADRVLALGVGEPTGNGPFGPGR